MRRTPIIGEGPMEHYGEALDFLPTNGNTSILVFGFETATGNLVRWTLNRDRKLYELELPPVTEGEKLGKAIESALSKKSPLCQFESESHFTPKKWVLDKGEIENPRIAIELANALEGLECEPEPIYVHHHLSYHLPVNGKMEVHEVEIHLDPEHRIFTLLTPSTLQDFEALRTVFKGHPIDEKSSRMRSAFNLNF